MKHADGRGAHFLLTHCAELHSADDAQVSPSALRATHVLPSQRPEVQSRDVAHGPPRSEVRTHVPLVHTERYAQRWAMSHASPSPTIAGATHVPFVHVAPVRHGFVSLQAWPGSARATHVPFTHASSG